MSDVVDFCDRRFDESLAFNGVTFPVKVGDGKMNKRVEFCEAVRKNVEYLLPSSRRTELKNAFSTADYTKAIMSQVACTSVIPFKVSLVKKMPNCLLQKS